MDETTESGARLKHAVKAAFGGLIYPGDAHLVYDNSAAHLECNQVREFFQGKRWQDITLDALLAGYNGDASACLNFMTPEAFRYYLPAYLFIAIDRFKESDVIPYSVVWKLTAPEHPGPDMDWFLSRVEGLSLEQRRVIIEFLQFMRTAHAEHFFSDDPGTALKRYWSKAAA
jgi:hypothetical protein